uniref:ATP-dependent Clp protease proteolytic subunit n=1 Tax=Glycosmis pentaphylla TaxID=76967 RepID=A0A1L2JLD1_9ROSI|nr:ATP-dependent Clp protease proteolytic subunit [Glycosmis pentaphylla]AOZ20900.1 ATP-dependent Clp protease proteolytic subunit [Glycosmis pentaphylla]
MPIGVPKVPYKIPGDRHPAWIDINRLYRERLLFLGQIVENDVSNHLIALMIYLSMESETKDLYLFINSPGGWVVPGIAIYDTMQFVRPDVQTICVGLAASMGSFLLAAGASTKRIAFPHQGHDPSTYCLFLWGTSGRIYPGYGRTTESARTPYNGLCRKIGQARMGCIRRHGKGYLYVSNRSPSSWTC